MMRISFGFDLYQDEFGGIMMYEVKRKRNTISDHQSSIDTISTKVIEEALKMIRLLITWKIDCSGKPRVNMVLVEYNNELVLNEDKLAQLYDKINCKLCPYYGSIWLMCDNTTLKAEYEVVNEESFELKIIISKGFRCEYIMKPTWIDSTRQVSYLMI
jgi:hypothetical protein